GLGHWRTLIVIHRQHGICLLQAAWHEQRIGRQWVMAAGRQILRRGNGRRVMGDQLQLDAQQSGTYLQQHGGSAMATSSQGCAMWMARSGPMSVGPPGVCARRTTGLAADGLIAIKADVDVGFGAQFLQPAAALFLGLALADQLLRMIANCFSGFVKLASIDHLDDGVAVGSFQYRADVAGLHLRDAEGCLWIECLWLQPANVAAFFSTVLVVRIFFCQLGEVGARLYACAQIRRQFMGALL